MISSFDIVNLKSLLQDFYAVVGIRISIFDDEFRLVTEFPTEPPAFCANIRSNAKWCDGVPVTANDFVYAWRRIVDPKSGSSYAVFLDVVKNADDIMSGE